MTRGENTVIIPAALILCVIASLTISYIYHVKGPPPLEKYCISVNMTHIVIDGLHYCIDVKTGKGEYIDWANTKRR